MQTDIRVVCHNTLSFALDSKDDYTKAHKIRHTSSADGELKKLKKLFEEAAAHRKQFSETAEKLADTWFFEQDRRWLVKSLLPAKDEDNPGKRLKNARSELWTKMVAGTGISSYTDTAWAALNGVVEWVDFHRPMRGENKDERRVLQTVTGPGQQLKQRAFDLITRRKGIGQAA